MIKLKERIENNDNNNNKIFMICTFQSIFTEKQLDNELDTIEIKSSKQIKRIVLHCMEQRRSTKTG